MVGGGPGEFTKAGKGGAAALASRNVFHARNYSFLRLVRQCLILYES
jgi:hypothetical protein